MSRVKYLIDRVPTEVVEKFGADVMPWNVRIMKSYDYILFHKNHRMFKYTAAGHDSVRE